MHTSVAPQLDRLERFGNQRIRGMKISVRRIRPPAESAKSAADDANVGEIQISVHHVGDAVADHAPAKLVRDFHQRQKVVPFDRGQRQSLFEAQDRSRRGLFPGRSATFGLAAARARSQGISRHSGFIGFSMGHTPLEHSHPRPGAFEHAVGACSLTNSGREENSG